jgi:hypothetical protein
VFRFVRSAGRDFPSPFGTGGRACFLDLDQYAAWFDADERELLADAGFVLLAYRVRDGFVVTDDRQAVADLRGADLIEQRGPAAL